MVSVPVSMVHDVQYHSVIVITRIIGATAESKTAYATKT